MGLYRRLLCFSWRVLAFSGSQALRGASAFIVAIWYLAANGIRVGVNQSLPLVLELSPCGRLLSHLQLFLAPLDVDIQGVQILNDVFRLTLPRTVRSHATLIVVAVSAL